MWITAYDPFDAQTDGYATMEVTYVMGPFAELTSDGKDHTEFYIAEDSEGYWSIIATKGETSLPVYGVDAVSYTHLDVYKRQGYICSMLFIIPGFPFITSGIDLAKLDLRSGLERLTYSIIIVLVATMFAWIMAMLLRLQPQDFTSVNLSDVSRLVLRSVHR